MLGRDLPPVTAKNAFAALSSGKPSSSTKKKARLRFCSLGRATPDAFLAQDDDKAKGKAKRDKPVVIDEALWARTQVSVTSWADADDEDDLDGGGGDFYAKAGPSAAGAWADERRRRSRPPPWPATPCQNQPLLTAIPPRRGVRGGRSCCRRRGGGRGAFLFAALSLFLRLTRARAGTAGGGGGGGCGGGRGGGAGSGAGSGGRQAGACGVTRLASSSTTLTRLNRRPPSRRRSGR